MIRFLLPLLVLLSGFAAADEINPRRIDFESTELNHRVESYTENGVVFALAHEPKKSKAKGVVMFFPHLATGHKGILCAMAEEPIPVRATFPRAASKVVLTMWGSTTSSAIVKAFDAEGKVVDEKSLDQVPVRKRPEDPMPMFSMTVEGEAIVAIEISGSRPGGFLAVDELSYELP